MYKNLPNSLFIGQNIMRLPSCQSTNSEARELLAKSAVPEGTVLVTRYQTSGRGQRGNSWESAEGKNLLATFILRPTFISPDRQFAISEAVSLAVADTLCEYDLSPFVKWPNDIVVNDRKVSGILIENIVKASTIAHALIGIGLNVNQKRFTNEKAISIAQALGQEVQLQEVLNSLCSNLESKYLLLKRGGASEVHEQYLQRLYRKDEKCLFQADNLFAGTIRDVHPQGLLTIETDTGLQQFAFKEVTMIY